MDPLYAYNDPTAPTPSPTRVLPKSTLMEEPNDVDVFDVMNVACTVVAGLLLFSNRAFSKSTAHTYELPPMKNDVAEPCAS